MISRERRACPRFILNHPVMMGIGEENGHLAEILDAGVEGMRVRVTDPSGFLVGHEIDISMPLQNKTDAVTLRCQVAWEDTENLEVGLKYIQ